METEPALFQLQRPTFKLNSLEVYNWGPFAGLHRAPIDPKGSAIIGSTGSGKTTLIDAFVTLLAEHPKYNLASTGGHESDRSLISYVRGLVGSGNDSGDDTHISRKGKTTTGLCATYGNGDEILRLAAIFWIDGNSFSASDLKKVWLFSRHPTHSLEQWLAEHDNSGLRSLKATIRDCETAQVFDSSNGGKRAYLARVRSYFEVSDNAFSLLNRAAGLKQLNSIDEIFRGLVLDDCSAFERALEVANDFNTLTDIHNELLVAKQQHDSLIPVRDKNKRHNNCDAKLKLQHELKRVLANWVALKGIELWGIKVEALSEMVTQKQADFDTRKTKTNDLKQREKSLYEQYAQVGGAQIDDLKKLLDKSSNELERRKTNQQSYQQLCQNLNLTPADDRVAFEQSIKSVKNKKSTLESSIKKAREDAYKKGAALHTQEQEVKGIREEIDEIRKNPGSNLPSNYQRFRAELSRELGIEANTIPFVAELLQVKASESEWRGAIERAIGGNRLRILMPTEFLKPALRWINHRHNALHVRLVEASKGYPTTAKFLEDGYTHKLEFKSHPLREAVKHFLARHDLHCVENSELLSTTEHALTREGTTSGRRGSFEKKDQKRLEADWYTGFDNRDRMSMLAKQIQAAEELSKQLKDSKEKAEQHVDEIQDQVHLLQQLAELEFDEIDVETTRSEQQQLNDRLSLLTDPESDAGKALQAYEEAKRAVEDIEEQKQKAFEALTEAKGNCDRAKRRLEDYKTRLVTPPTESEIEIANRHLPFPETLRAEDIDLFERNRRNEIDQAIEDLQGEKLDLQKELVRAMAKAKAVDTGALAEVDTELSDVQAYLERLIQLTEEDLPNKRKRFLDYLNQSSDQGVTQLLTSIEEEVSKIEERIAELNRGLESVDFKDGRFLRLELKQVAHESLRTLKRALQKMRHVVIQGENNGEAHYKALQEVVRHIREAAEKKQTVGARALLDPRYRVEFHGAEVERSSGRVIERFKGSQGGSGGEKEIIASYILTASLCYALSPEGAQHPLHSTIILDEAFSKSSRTVANRIIKALREFQLHPIFVTPNKEMRLLRTHTNSVVYVHRKGFRATLASITWEELQSRIEGHRTIPPFENPR